MKDFKSKRFGDKRNSGGGYGNKRGGGGGFRSRDNDRPSYGSRDRGGFNNRSFDRGPKSMFEATCADCGDNCEVPFRPTGERPVKCSNCFDKRADRPSRDRGERPFKKEFSAPKPDPRIDELKAELRTVQSKLDTMIALLESSTAATPKKSGVKKITTTAVSTDDTPILFDYTPEVIKEDEAPKKKKRVIPSREEAVAGIVKAKKEIKKTATKKTKTVTKKSTTKKK